ncbi:unnamed protein product, partial [Ixodes persulcatus]
MRNFVPLILAVSGVYLLDQGHSSHQDSSESSGIVVPTPLNIEDDTSASRSRGGYLTSEHSNQDLDLNSEAIRFKDRLNRTKRSWGDMSAIYEVYTDRKRNGTSGYYPPAIIARYMDDIPSVAALLDPNQKLYLLVHGWLGSSASLSNISNSSSSSRSVKDEELAQIKDELLRVVRASCVVLSSSSRSETGTTTRPRDVSGFHWIVLSVLGSAGSADVPESNTLTGGAFGRLQTINVFRTSLQLVLQMLPVYRSSSLDPLDKDFEDEHLDRDDADFVDVIHTEHGVYKLGILEPIGHVDFYPNGGGMQLGCKIRGCSHKRAKIYYLNSIERCWYTSRCCPGGAYISPGKMYCWHWKTSCGRMGHHASSDLRGVHYLSVS